MDAKKLKTLAAELAKGLKTEADLNAFSRMLTKLTVQTALNTELTHHLGNEKTPPKMTSAITYPDFPYDLRIESHICELHQTWNSRFFTLINQ